MRLMKRMLAMCLAVGLVVSMTGCGGGAKKTESITIYDGQFAEMQIIHQMVKYLVEANTDITVDIKDQMAPVNAYNELLKGSNDIMNSYDGTVLTTFLGLDPSDVPTDKTLYDYVNEQCEEKEIRLLGKLGINNTYAVAVPQKIADEYDLNTISDLVPVADKLVFGAEHDFFTEEGSAKYNPFVEFYGLKFQDAKQIDMSLKYSAVESGNIDCTVVYATDGQNKKAKLKVLEDDRTFFPEYNGALLVREDLFERFKDTAPDLEDVLRQMDGIFTQDDMIDLTYAVDVDLKSVEDVAKEYLVAKGLLE